MSCFMLTLVLCQCVCQVLVQYKIQTRTTICLRSITLTQIIRSATEAKYSTRPQLHN